MRYFNRSSMICEKVMPPLSFGIAARARDMVAGL